MAYSDEHYSDEHYSDEHYESRRARIGKASYIVAITVTILLGVATFFGDELGLTPVLRDAADILLEVDEILSQEEPYVVPQEEPGEAGQSNKEWYQIYFTQPTCPPPESRSGGLDEIILNDLDDAQQQVDMAIFDLDAELIVNALIELEAQGIPVRVVTDEDHSDQESIRRLRRHGISVVEDKRRAFMHNKFIVIDNHVVWTGSTNLTSNGIYCNNNNLVRIESAKLAENYLTEMDEMYVERSFGPSSANTTPHEELAIDGTTVENFFAPEKKLVNAIARTVARAQEEILFMAFAFTNEDIGEAMLGRAEAGVPVQGIFEGLNAQAQRSYFPLMEQSGIESVEVRLDANPKIMHHKVIIVDRKTTVFGSFNFTGNANRQNDENIVIVHDADFTRAFVQEFERRWSETEPDTGFWNQLFE